MDSKTVKLNCLTLGELENLPIFKKSGVFLYSVVLWKVVLCFTGGERDSHGVMARQEGFHFGVDYAFKPTITLHCITKNKYAEHITDSMKTIKQG